MAFPEEQLTGIPRVLGDRRDCKDQTVARARVRVTEPTLPPQPTKVLPIAAWLALAAGAIVIALTILGAVTR